MSVDTRTPRTPTGGSSSGYDDQPALSTVKVPSDPAQVSGNHLSFRVQLARPPHRARQFAGIAADTTQLPTVKGPAKRRAPVVWSGRAAPGDAAPTQLLDAMHAAVAGGGDAGATQVLPRLGVDADAPATVVGPRGPAEDHTQLLRGMRPTVGAFDEQPYPNGEFDDEADWPDEDDGATDRSRQGGDSVRHAYYPGRRMDLGVVLLPLRIFLGLISVYAGMGKLCDPVYFDGGKRGSMVTWLTSLHPWAAAAPLREFALAHPVGSGLTVAFLQIIVGVLTIFGLWQRLAAAVGALLSIALMVTVSWRTHPVYDTPDIIYLAAWSPLVIAGAPFYSLDGRLAGEAWRRLGPRAAIGDLRRRVLRRGAAMATVLIGLSLLTGSMLGGAVRSAQPAARPGSPSVPPVNSLPGSPLPQRPETGTTPRGTHGPAGPGSPRPSATGRRTATPSATPPAQGAVKSPTGAAGSSRPGATSGGPRPAPQTPHQRSAAPAAPHSPTGAATSGGTGGNGPSGNSGSSGGLSGGGALGGLLG
ncbi:DoxX family protein [Streptomyces luteireticuli]|uniref:DoxX family protein n=1 Tax=Streptomyces luteireticuli TaxID=173858 RepID=UPI0031D74B5D